MPLKSATHTAQSRNTKRKQTVFGEEETFGHLAEIIFVQKLALIALLAEAAQPMLADDLLVAGDVPQRTQRTECAHARRELDANRAARLVHAGERRLKAQRCPLA